MKRFKARKAHLISMLFLSVSLFASGANATDPIPPNIGTAGNFEIHSTPSINVGDIGVSLIAANERTEFGLITDPSNSFPISSLVTESMTVADDDNQSCALSKTNHTCLTGQ